MQVFLVFIISNWAKIIAKKWQIGQCGRKKSTEPSQSQSADYLMDIIGRISDMTIGMGVTKRSSMKIH